MFPDNFCFHSLLSFCISTFSNQCFSWLLSLAPTAALYVTLHHWSSSNHFLLFSFRPMLKRGGFPCLWGETLEFRYFHMSERTHDPRRSSSFSIRLLKFSPGEHLFSTGSVLRLSQVFRVSCLLLSFFYLLLVSTGCLVLTSSIRNLVFSNFDRRLLPWLSSILLSCQIFDVR